MGWPALSGRLARKAVSEERGMDRCGFFVLGFDLGKNVCGLVGLDEAGVVALRHETMRPPDQLNLWDQYHVIGAKFNNLYIKDIIQFRYDVLNNINIVGDFAYFYLLGCAKFFPGMRSLLPSWTSVSRANQTGTDV